MPPKEAWVIPPLIKTIRFETIYVPMMPQLTAASIAASIAFLKKSYDSSSCINVGVRDRGYDHVFPARYEEHPHV